MNEVNQCIHALSKIIRGKDQEIRLAVCCLLARGHLLIEDLPGMGKTTLVHALAQVLGLGHQRVQFTSDLLPADITGVTVFDKNTSTFVFQSGPVFSQLLLADEINRASPRTQSALLEAMEERQVSVNGQRQPLPDPFFVVATQNPVYQEGTFPLPESQLDRFLMQLELGYPDPESEKAILKGEAGRVELGNLSTFLIAEQLIKLQNEVIQVHVGDMLLDYVMRLITKTREAEYFKVGLSPRAGLALMSAAKAWAWMEGRDYVIPEDVQAVFVAVVGHRLQVKEQGKSVRELLTTTQVMG
ncbi:AAA family ATPase [Endozoicomonas numazuensis]|uniref:ATPase AAA n=1 Tax=Endozoicomonas numazuensis TaxID=1137799 RepID=A0A081N117_9GAMM|nr:MoxR family ATPase [Endozoicomonas numazuensis]KEQ12140.1 ATPase AAA [Endozoicomonas numazuensis]KEQ13065.1 ATPase AAA [Endozoicomonas numazuensis]